MRLASLALFAAVSLLVPTRAALSQSSGRIAALPTAASSFVETDLVSDLPDRARFRDTDLVNPWGIVPGGRGTFWVSDNGADVSTLYNPDGTKVGLTVHI